MIRLYVVDFINKKPIDKRQLNLEKGMTESFWVAYIRNFMEQN